MFKKKTTTITTEHNLGKLQSVAVLIVEMSFNTRGKGLDVKLLLKVVPVLLSAALREAEGQQSAWVLLMFHLGTKSCFFTECHA